VVDFFFVRSIRLGNVPPLREHKTIAANTHPLPIKEIHVIAGKKKWYLNSPHEIRVITTQKHHALEPQGPLQSFIPGHWVIPPINRGRNWRMKAKSGFEMSSKCFEIPGLGWVLYYFASASLDEQTSTRCGQIRYHASIRNISSVDSL